MKEHNQADEKKKLDEGTAEEKLVTLKDSEYSKLKEEAKKASEYWEKLLRLQADFENSRKRMEKERQDFFKFANEGIILELLNILDDLERAVELAQEKHQDQAALLKGVEMIMAHIYGLLKNNGVKPIEAKGKLFDPHYHEALMQAENKEFPENTIVEELQKGYFLNDKVIRTTKVKVTKRP